MGSRHEPLKPGGCIGLIAPSSPVKRERFEAGVKIIKTYGYDVKVPIDPCQSFGSKEHLFSSASVQDRVNAIEDLIRDPDVAVIMSVRGAYGSMELLPFLDYALIARNPKIFVGLSDVTALLTAVYSKAGISTLHGPGLESVRLMQENGNLKPLEILFKFLAGEKLSLYKDYPLESLCGGSSGTGPLVGGNLCVLASLMGTAWEPEFDGHILFFEESGEKPYRIHRMLLQMKLAGKFDLLRGVVIGDLKNCSHPQSLGPDVFEVIKDIFGEFSFPVLYGLPFGHDKINLPVPIGVKAEIVNNILELKGQFVLS